MLKVSPTRTGLCCDGSMSLDAWKATTPQGSDNFIPDCTNRVKELLEARMVIQAGAVPAPQLPG